MTIPSECRLASILAQRLRENREALVLRWLERIAHRVALSPGQIFPSEDLIDHVPRLIDGIAAYVEDPVEEISADVPVLSKAMELGELRYRQGSSAHQILWEYEILGGVLYTFLGGVVGEIDQPHPHGELLLCAHRVFRAIAVIQQYTTDHFIRLTDDRVHEREEQLRRFSRAVSHELKNRLGAAGGALAMLQEQWVLDDSAKRDRFISIAASNVAAMGDTLDGLLELSRIDWDSGPARNILLPDAAAEVRRRLRDFAQGRGVKIEVATDLPWVEVPAATVELALSNYLTNAVKYRNQEAHGSWARVEGELRGDEQSCEVVVRVRDNGMGVPVLARGKLFERFFRAHQGVVRDEEGSGIGLSLVRETVEAAGGRAWAEFPEDGAVFAFSLPCPTGTHP
jgi:signal transduction histidine kinase